MRWNLKEAGGKIPYQRTGIAYKAEQERISLLDKESPILPELHEFEKLLMTPRPKQR